MPIVDTRYDCKAKEAVTAHINREVGPNIATASTVVLENTRGEGDAKDIDSQIGKSERGATANERQN